MDDLTSSYRIGKMEIKLEGETTDGRQVTEVITIGTKPVASKPVRSFRACPDMPPAADRFPISGRN